MISKILADLAHLALGAAILGLLFLSTQLPAPSTPTIHGSWYVTTTEGK